nr:methylated-DNA--protein-cysteine methyltransferase isoform X2 [Podarcis muralis]XP_028585765.1 methylated-DNA--protein-cysteine methyltransferase isoform X2 [Podarcis muralis]XP_028585766.1 methylated-DNA--protein-cysteine methyltransferase isoform X2 [Podarcis muralis]
MASKLHQKAFSQCEKMFVVLGSPLGKIEISGCKLGVHEIHLERNAVLQNGFCFPQDKPPGWLYGNVRCPVVVLVIIVGLVHQQQVSYMQLPAGASVSCEVCEASEETAEPLKQCVAWFQAYFCEPWMIEKLPVPPFHHPLLENASFTREVLWTLLRDVKFGEAVSYKQLADLAGNSKAARAVGGAMRSNPVPIIIPCHRVICSGGQTGNYTGGSHLKEWLLSHEKLQKEKLAY